MKTLRDTNNNNNNNNNNSSTNQQYFSSSRQTFDSNQLSSLIQNSIFPIESINPLLYLQQLMNTNAMFMQSNENHSMDTNIFIPKTRPMSQEEIAEHARLVYQRALQRNQIQQHQDLIKHLYERFHVKQNPYQVPTVPTATNLTSYDILDTMIKSPSSCVSVKETSLNTAGSSSLSLQSVDDTKLLNNSNSALDPSAPIFIPRQNQQKLDDDADDDDNESSSSSSSDSDFHDFHYLDQFLDDFYRLNQQQTNNHLILSKRNSIEKYSIHSHLFGQGDPIEQTTSIRNLKQDYQYSIYDLLNRYRNPRCHLVLPEWSRLSLILPNVCSMRTHTYKLKRYFAYRRHLTEIQEN